MGKFSANRHFCEFTQPSLVIWILNLLVLTNNRHPKNIFNFLGLPRELRDMIYVYIVGKHRKLPLPIYESTMSVQIEEIENEDTPWLCEGHLGYDPA
jgi:hypothetical protein